MILNELKEGKLEAVYKIENISEVNNYVQMVLQLEDWNQEITIVTNHYGRRLRWIMPGKALLKRLEK